MKLTKVQENLTRVYTDGVDEERIDNRRFEITDADGARIGEAVVYVGGYTISMSGATASIEDGEAAVKKMLNITE
jgi:hypothetical protein